MTTIDLGNIDDQTSRDAFWSVRGKAINSYAILESSLCSLFSTLSETKPEIAGIIFYRNANARSRNEVIKALVKKRHAARFSVWINSFVKAVAELDRLRNEIVHWHSVVDVFAGESGLTVTSLSLMPPNFWVADMSTPKHTFETMSSFIAKCDFASRACNIFNAGVHGLGGYPDRSSEFLSEFSYPTKL